MLSILFEGIFFKSPHERALELEREKKAELDKRVLQRMKEEQERLNVKQELDRNLQDMRQKLKSGQIKPEEFEDYMKYHRGVRRQALGTEEIPPEQQQSGMIEKVGEAIKEHPVLAGLVGLAGAGLAAKAIAGRGRR